MSQRPIMDAGPGINFLSVNKERLLFGTLGPLTAQRQTGRLRGHRVCGTSVLSWCAAIKSGWRCSAAEWGWPVVAP
jgi:hypothetical protein